ncbi:MAG TPA: glycogen/starch synthase [Ktedonobacterales bacterium]|jgi:starch synthase
MSASAERLRILFVATEAFPLAKEGGVADVMGSLPVELARLGHDVRLFLPRYGAIDPARWTLAPAGYHATVRIAGVERPVAIWRTTLPGADVTVYLLENEEYFGQHARLYLGQDQLDEQRRFVLLCRGLLDALPALDAVPDVFHLNDWQTAPCAALLRTSHRHLLRAGRGRIVYTIHNLQYQGRWDPTILDDAGLERARLFGPDGLEYWGDVNWMKAGITYADAVTTVSRRYAAEIQTLDHGWGLDELLARRHSRLFGIPNGIDWDAWNPATDRALAARYSAARAAKIASAKRANRTAVRAEFGLADDPAVPLVTMVTRLVEQKGVDLLRGIGDELCALPLQLLVLGAGQPEYEAWLADLSATSANVRARIGYDADLSRRLYAGGDFFLMPSAFEPGGLGQLIALRYGTLPIARATGGLADTITDVDADPERGNGISFAEYTPAALLEALGRALRLFADAGRWAPLPARAMAYDSRWSASAGAYADLYRRVLRLPNTGQ